MAESYKLSDLFGVGNQKLGKKVLTWSIPAILTCPGRTQRCESLCYADKGFFKMSNAQSRYHKNWKFSERDDFQTIAVKALKAAPKGTLLRIHVAGDFYSKEYVNKWYYILKNSPHIQAWVYTRSWRIPDILPAIKKLAALPNLSLWFSVDGETGNPKNKPKGVRTAYMMIDDNDKPKYMPDLYFRDHSLRKGAVKYVNGTLVCPAENGASGHVTCEKCKICVVDPISNPNKRTHNRDISQPAITKSDRIALPIV